MKLVLLLAIVSSTLIPSLLPGLKAKEMPLDSSQLKGTLYGNLLEELNGAHLLIAASHVSVIYIVARTIKNLVAFFENRCHLQ